MSDYKQVLSTLTSEQEAAIAEYLRNSKVGLFSERDNTNDALEYAQSVGDGTPNGATIGVMVYHNTVLECLAKSFES